MPESAKFPRPNLCAINLWAPAATSMAAFEYERSVKTPVEDCLKAVGPDKILYIVLAYLRPFRIDPGGLHDYALDSYLADIWDFCSTKPIEPAPGNRTPITPTTTPRRTSSSLSSRSLIFVLRRTRQ